MPPQISEQTNNTPTTESHYRKRRVFFITAAIVLLVLAIGGTLLWTYSPAARLLFNEITNRATLVQDDSADLTSSFNPDLRWGPAPLQVGFGVYGGFPSSATDESLYNGAVLDYGDGNKETLKETCGSANCGIVAQHTYAADGVYTVKVHASSTSQVIRIFTITVGNPLSFVKKIGQTESSFLIQKINADSVEGAWTEAYPVAHGSIPKILHVGDDIGYSCEGVSDKLTSINYTAQTIVFIRTMGGRPFGGCPICLSKGTLIDTPHGLVAVENLQTGQDVWTSTKDGVRVATKILEVSHTPVPATHKVVRLVLENGRELDASPGHPTADGRTIGELSTGDILNGSRIKSTTLIPYQYNFTYDLLPVGDTGTYWANGILIGSTLFGR